MVQEAMRALQALEAFLSPQAYRDAEPEQLQSLVVLLDSMAMRLMDLADDLRHGSFGARARPRERTRTLAKVREKDGSEVVVRVLELTSSGARVLDPESGERFVPHRRILCIMPQRSHGA